MYAPPRHSRRPLSLCLSLCFVGGLMGHPMGQAQALTLAEAMGHALAHDPTYLAATQAREAGLEKRAQGRANLLPTISATADARKLDIDGVSRELDYRSYVVSLNQPLLDLAAIRAAQQGSQSAIAAEASFGTARQDALLRVAAAYFDVLNAQEALSVTQAEKKAIGEQLESAKRSFEVGTATVTDQQEAQARFDLILASEIRAQNSLNVKRQALSLIMGQSLPAKLPDLRANLQIPSPTPMNAEDWVAQARAGNFGVLRAQADQERARLDVSRQVAGHLPSLDIVAARLRGRETTGIDSRSDSNYVGLSLTVPIIAGGATTSLVREASALHNEARHKLDAARLAAEQTAREAYLTVVAGLAQISALQAAERSSQLALESNRLGYEVGVRINIDVLNAQQQLFAAQRDLAKARNDTLLASLQLRAAVGGLQPADVEAVSQVISAR
ncbi:MAG TPA: TolC family outer membrane protein, partial [Burkholderiaceae bacterium]|nr:TolC family outer membrane protein [Burkholderiaceae bacterium]